ncbi:MAG: hypothetical protein A2X58_11290 [Nitrospirae bacterium GWC2_56_14]|nr:MAG: hypothetical protein A2X58_11290 [Nitrospirae bacterium GWC2_56_14]
MCGGQPDGRTNFEATMGKLTDHLIEHLLEVLWAFFIICLILAGLALIFGRSVGYELTSLAGAGFAIVAAGIFAVIVAANLIWIGLVRLRARFSGKHHKNSSMKKGENEPKP